MKLGSIPVVVLLLALTFGAGAAVGIFVGADDAGAFPVAPPQDEQGRYVVTITRGHEFVPAAALVPAGAIVVWRSESSTAHDVTALDRSFGSDAVLGGKMREGDVFEQAFESGVHRYECRLHSGHMQGMIIVEG